MRALAALLLFQTLTIYVSPRHPYSLAYDPAVWTSNGSDEADIDLVLTHRSGKVQAVLYAFAGETTLDALRASALKNGKEVAPDLKVVAEERTKRNGASILTMEMRGKSAAYRGIYWTGGGEAIQLVAATTKETDADVKALLDGLSITVPEEEKRAFTIDFSPLKWRVEDDGSKDGTMLWVHTAGDLKAIATAERVDIAANGLRDYVMVRAKVLAPDAKIVAEEARTVAGRAVTMLQIEGITTDRVPVVMLGYFYRQTGVCVQAVTFTPRAQFAQRKADMLEFLDGLQIHLPRE